MEQAAFQLLCHRGSDHRKDRNSCCLHGFTKNRDRGKINWFEWKMSSACFCEEKKDCSNMPKILVTCIGVRQRYDLKRVDTKKRDIRAQGRFSDLKKINLSVA